MEEVNPVECLSAFFKCIQRRGDESSSMEPMIERWVLKGRGGYLLPFGLLSKMRNITGNTLNEHDLRETCSAKDYKMLLKWAHFG